MSLTARTDVTAVKFHRNNIFVGIGSYVNIFEKETRKLLQRLQGLKGQKIYSFVVSKCERKILAFGGKQFTMLNERGSQQGGLFSRCFEPVLCDDWLHSAVWIDEETVALLTAHNVVQKWNISTQTLVVHHPSTDNSILYSGFLLPVADELIILAGTVFSKVIIHRCNGDKNLHNLKGHRGVIFSICCEPSKQTIVTTSDDRSVRIWHMNNPNNYHHDSLEFWDNITIECRHEVYGHVARVMRSIITNDFVVSVGEDAGICYWDLQGNFLRKVVSHNTATIWSIDSDGHHLVTGGGDGSIILHPLSVASDYGDKEVLNIEEIPKKVIFTARNNIVILNEDNNLIYYDVTSKSKMVHKLLHETTYKMLAISLCKQLIAAADMNGKLDVFVENCKGDAYIQNVIDEKLNVGKILSMHWAGNRHLVICAEDGAITVLAARGNQTEVYAKFSLPPCKERWLTCCTIDPRNNMIICGDRNSGMHFFLKGRNDPVKSFKRVHGNYGSTSLTVKNDEIISTGRDRTIKYYSIMEDVKESKYLTSKELEFQWVEKFLDKDEKLICGFQEKTFVVHNVKTNARILDIICGGGHRSWDAVRYFDKVNGELEEFIRLIYLKNSNVYLVTFQLSKIVSKNIVSCSQSKEINCLKTYRNGMDRSTTYYISGGEDTTLRISTMDTEFKFQDEVIYKHLSNIRALKVFSLKDNRILVLSAGGRAQTCINLFKFDLKVGDSVKTSSQELVNHMLRGTDNERKRGKTWRNQEVDFDPETRIMDLDAVKIDDNIILTFAGCSDSYLRVFKFDNIAKDAKFENVKEIKFHKTCILKTVCIKIFARDIVVTCSSRGEVTFWNVTNNDETFNVEPFFTISPHNSGINSFAYKILDGKLIIATGGDDNSVTLNLLEIKATDSEKILISKVHNWSLDSLHCSQVTGLLLVEDLMISTSIDQRVTICKWEVAEDGIRCKFLKQLFTDIADVQGLEIVESSSDSLTVCVFGKGIEVLKIDLP